MVPVFTLLVAVVRFGFLVTVCKTDRPVLLSRCPLCPVCLSVTLVYCGHRPNGWMDGPPLFGQCLLRPNSLMDQGATWYGGSPRPRSYCVRWRPNPSPSPERGTVAPLFSTHVYCGQTVTHLTYC